MSVDEQELAWKINNVREAISLDWKHLTMKNLTADQRNAIREHGAESAASLKEKLDR